MLKSKAKKIKNLIVSFAILFMAIILLYGFANMISNGSYYLVENMEKMNKQVDCDKSSVDNNTVAIEDISEMTTKMLDMNNKNEQRLKQLESDLKKQEQTVKKVEMRCIKANQ